MDSSVSENKTSYPLRRSKRQSSGNANSKGEQVDRFTINASSFSIEAKQHSTRKPFRFEREPVLVDCINRPTRTFLSNEMYVKASRFLNFNLTLQSFGTE